MIWHDSKCIEFNTFIFYQETEAVNDNVFDVISELWCPIPALLVISPAQKPCATHNKVILQFGNTTGGSSVHRRRAIYGNTNVG